jgi:hypothetical protein
MERWGLISSSFCCSHSVAAGGETYRTASLVDSSESKMVKKKPDIIVQEETFSRHHQDFGNKGGHGKPSFLFYSPCLSHHD